MGNFKRLLVEVAVEAPLYRYASAAARRKLRVPAADQVGCCPDRCLELASDPFSVEGQRHGLVCNLRRLRRRRSRYQSCGPELGQRVPKESPWLWQTRVVQSCGRQVPVPSLRLATRFLEERRLSTFLACVTTLESRLLPFFIANHLHVACACTE